MPEHGPASTAGPVAGPVSATKAAMPCKAAAHPAASSAGESTVRDATAPRHASTAAPGSSTACTPHLDH
jgi:hypothetical protein